MAIKFHVDSFYVEFQADFLTRLTYFFLYVSSLQAMKRPGWKFSEKQYDALKNIIQSSFILATFIWG